MKAASSLRRKALLWMTAPPVLLGATAFAIAYNFDLRQANSLFDAQLRDIALYSGAGSATDAPIAPRDPTETFVLRVWSADGTIERETPGAVDLPRPEASGFATVEIGGTRWRVFSLVEPRQSVAVAQRMVVRDGIGRNAGIEAALPVLLATVLTWGAVGWMLKSLGAQLRGLAETISRRSLDSRDPVPLGDTPREVAPLVEGMNTLTARLQEAIDREKRFVADAAHELRTPLAALQIQLDNLAVDAEASVKPVLGDFRAGLGRARGLVEQLLRLARTEGEADWSVWEEVDVSALVKACVADLVLIAEAKGVDLGLACDEGVRMRGSRAELSLLFGNLIDNAVRYTPSGGSVDVAIRRDGDRFRVEVLDTGCGVAEADIPRLFERFYRAAGGGVEGTGLGLSIAKAVARRHGLSITLGNRADRPGFVARVSSGARPGDLIRS